jgi:TolB-like protein/Tfp pilus assembly protein PilF
MPSLFRELVRRKVFRSAALYLAAAWLVLQVADIVLDAFETSPAIMRALIVAFTVGFPVFLLLSWFYELRGARLVKDTGGSEPAPRRWTTRAANITIAVMVVLGAGIYFYSQDQTARDAATSEAGLRDAAEAESESAIAVLPLVNISRDPADQFLADGLTEELVNVLTSIPQLRVTARASSFAFRDTDKDARTIGEQLGVGHLIEGSVRRDADRLRISVQLVDTQTGNTRWSAAYNRTLTDIFEIQKDIAERVSGTLQLSLFSDPTPIIRRTTPEAYSDYLRALFLYRTGSRDGYAQAVAELETVIERDDQYAPAWSLLASVRQNQAIIGEVDYAEGHEMARANIERALAIDSNYAYAVSSRAWLAMSYERDFRLAAQNFRRALELAPNEPAILGNSAVLERLLGRIDRAIELSNQSIARNPLAATAFNNLSDQLYQARRYAEAIESARRALELAPGSPAATVNLAVSEIFAEDPEAALKSVAAIEIPFYNLFVEALAHFDLGDQPTADAALAALIEGYADQRAAYIAAIHSYRGEVDEAFGWLQQAIDARQRTLAVRTEPLYDNLRDDPRWQRVLEQLGLSDQQVAGIEI